MIIEYNCICLVPRRAAKITSVMSPKGNGCYRGLTVIPAFIWS